MPYNIRSRKENIGIKKEKYDYKKRDIYNNSIYIIIVLKFF